MLPQRWGKRLKLQESTQRIWCRCGFLALALLPSLVLLVGWGWSRTPWTRHWERQAVQSYLSGRLGVTSRISHLQALSPFRRRLTGLDIHHPETGEVMARIDEAEILRRSSGWEVLIARMQVHSPSALQLADRLHECVLRQPDLIQPPLAISIRQLEFAEEEGTADSYRVVMEYRGDEQCSRGLLTLQPTKLPVSARSRVEVERWHQLEEPLTRIVLQTGDEALPAELVATFCPWSRHLGDQVKYQGNLEWLCNGPAWSLVLQGRLKDVAWEPVTARLAHRLVGHGELQLDEARILNGQLLQAVGSVSSAAGKISRDWLRQAHERLGLGIDPEIIRSAASMVSFEKIGFGFHISGEGVAVHGQIPAHQANYLPSLMADGGEGLVYPTNPPQWIPLDRIQAWLISHPESTAGDHAVRTAAHRSLNGAGWSAPVARWLSAVLPTPASAPSPDLAGQSIQR
jgi:hypothetical protein